MINSLFCLFLQCHLFKAQLIRQIAAVLFLLFLGNSLAYASYTPFNTIRVGNVEGLEFMNANAVTTGHSQTAQQFLGGDFSQQVTQDAQDFINAQEVDAQKNNPALGANRVTENIGKISVTSDQDQGVCLDNIINDIVRSGGIKVADIRSCMSSITDNQSNGTRTVSVNEKIHGLSAQKFTFIRKDSRVKNTGLDGFAGNWREFTQDAFNVHPCSKSLQNDMDRSSSSYDAGFSVLNARVDADVLANINHRESISCGEKLSNSNTL